MSVLSLYLTKKVMSE